MHIDGTTALVTGGRRGLGAALVTTLLDQGAAKVHATSRHLFTDPGPAMIAMSTSHDLINRARRACRGVVRGGDRGA